MNILNTNRRIGAAQAYPAKRQGLPEANRRGNQLQVKNQALRQCPEGRKVRKNNSALGRAGKPIV